MGRELKNRELLDFTLIIPTLGKREQELNESLYKLSQSDSRCHLIFIAPEGVIDAVKEIASAYCKNFEVCYIVEEKNSTLPKAINQGLSAIQTEFWNWVGDDDCIILDEIARIVSVLSSDTRLVLGVGSCKYFSSYSKREYLNKATRLSTSMIFWGPNLVPQPSVVFRTMIARQMGGVDPNFQFAFDQDFVSKCLRIGKAYIHDSVTSEYRWSDQTLTSKFRKQSLHESYKIRSLHAKSVYQKIFVHFTFPIVITIIRISDLVFKTRFRK